MTSNIIDIVAFGVGIKCPRKINLNTQCPPPPRFWQISYQYLNQGGGIMLSQLILIPPEFQTFRHPWSRQSSFREPTCSFQHFIISPFKRIKLTKNLNKPWTIALDNTKGFQSSQNIIQSFFINQPTFMQYFSYKIGLIFVVFHIKCKEIF